MDAKRAGIIAKVGKLLDLARDQGDSPEGRAARAKAYELMRKFNIDEDDLGSRSSRGKPSAGKLGMALAFIRRPVEWFLMDNARCLINAFISYTVLIYLLQATWDWKIFMLWTGFFLLVANIIMVMAIGWVVLFALAFFHLLVQ